MNRTLRTAIRKYHVPHDGPRRAFPKEDNLFGDVQSHLCQQLNVRKMVITINNPIYISKETPEHMVPYSVDMHYGHNRYIHSLEGSNCETLVRQSITWIIANQPN